MKSEKGQVIVLLILVMTVALAIGISVVQRSLSDISTSTKVEESSRALFAAEAGIERRLKDDLAVSVSLENNSSAEMDNQELPCIPGVLPCPAGQQAALELPSRGKEEIFQVWLADRNSSSNPPAEFYKQPSLDVYWGNSADDKAALGLTLVFYEGGVYKTKKWFLDHDILRYPDNRFERVTCSGYPVGSNNYQCKKTLTSLPAGLMLIRARLLYNTNDQPFAVQASWPCSLSSGCYLPEQAKSVVSTGRSGQTQRKVQLFQTYKEVPVYFDFALFSIGEISK